MALKWHIDTTESCPELTQLISIVTGEEWHLDGLVECGQRSETLVELVATLETAVRTAGQVDYNVEEPARTSGEKNVFEGGVTRGLLLDMKNLVFDNGCVKGAERFVTDGELLLNRLAVVVEEEWFDIDRQVVAVEHNFDPPHFKLAGRVDGEQLRHVVDLIVDPVCGQDLAVLVLASMGAPGVVLEEIGVHVEKPLVLILVIHHFGN
eukprot:CAMPEP_0116943010 /NCGR_PEP_ID=MMETSP0467-20121206/34929_1 /TAXON_ID=283647 /ORGANISM="Mesodinium pulex, Strain SPMC105" /LENGTH=207 /DNA_ID=CAMNT_0004626103 /DNA_START=77 /DNA_END=701 /DNA_ORIENTATION=-